MASNTRSTAKNRHNNDPVDELKRRSRRRLVGAIALFFAAVIIVPALVETEPPQTQAEVELVVPERVSSEATTPPAQEGDVAPQTTESVPSSEQKPTDSPAVAEVPKTSTSHAQSDVPTEKPMELIYPPERVESKASEPRVTTEPKPEKAESKPEPKRAEKVEATKPESKPAETKKSEKTEKAEGKSKKNDDVIASFADDEGPSITLYWVQVAAVGDKSRADQLRSELSGKGFAAKVESAGSLYRVRVGPFTNQNKAESALAQLGAAGHQGRVVR